MQPLQHVQITQLAEYHYRTWRIIIDPKKTDLADLFRPQYWVNAIKFKVHDLVRVIATDHSFDFMLTVTGKPESGAGLVVHSWPTYPAAFTGPMVANAQEMADAAEVVKRELIATTVSGKAVPRVEHTVADGWRVIDIAGGVQSKNHRSEAAANIAMSNYLAQLGISEVAGSEASPESAEPVSKKPKRASASAAA